MLLDSDIEKLYRRLLSSDSAQFFFCGSELTIRILDQASKLSVTTPVYTGSNYIPKSVRTCIEKAPPFRSDLIKTYISVDNEQFKVSLHYLGKMDAVNNRNFKELLTEFCEMAEQWRDYLDEHDKKDLLHVRVP